MIHEREDYNKRVVCTDGSIPEDEPVFLLRGKDITSFYAIMEWIKENRAHEYAGRGKLVSVLRHALEMRKYALNYQEKNAPIDPPANISRFP